MSEFSKNEAEALLGTRIKTTVDFSGVPKGSTGVVVGADKASRSKYTVAVKWDIAGNLVDWFSKSEFYRFLVLERDGRRP